MQTEYLAAALRHAAEEAHSFTVGGVTFYHLYADALRDMADEAVR